MKNVIVFLIASYLLSSCQTAYYKIWETLGREKRDLLESNVEKAGDEQRAMENEFEDILSRIRSEYDFDGGEIERLYDQLKSDYENVVAKKEQLEERSDSIHTIANDLFKEWKREAQGLSNRRYKEDSLKKLRIAKDNFKRMSASLKNTQDRLNTVTKQFKDHVTYLKHNLNAKSLDVFKTEINSIKDDMEKLISTVKLSIKQSDDFKKVLP